MAVQIGIDFGARNVKIYKEGDGIVLREPNLAAVDTKGNVLAVGTDALMLHTRAPGTVTLRRPIENGSVTDFNLVAELLDRFLERVAPKVNKHITIALKYGLGGRSREIIKAALSDCRTGKIKIVDSAAAALLGCGIVEDHTDEYGGTLVCDVGASIVEAAYLRSCELLRVQSSVHGGDFADLEICTYMRAKYGLSISRGEARDAKHKINLTGENTEKVTFSGSDTVTGMPKRVEIPVEELLLPCREYVDGVPELIKTAIKNLPVHGSNESHVEQVVLLGGGAEMAGFGEFVADGIGHEITMPTSVTDCVIEGIACMIERSKRSKI